MLETYTWSSCVPIAAVLGLGIFLVYIFIELSCENVGGRCFFIYMFDLFISFCFDMFCFDIFWVNISFVCFHHMVWLITSYERKVFVNSIICLFVCFVFFVLVFGAMSRLLFFFGWGEKFSCVLISGDTVWFSFSIFKRSICSF